MFIAIGILLFLVWLLGFFLFHIAGVLIYILLVLAILSIIFHFVRAFTRRST